MAVETPFPANVRACTVASGGAGASCALPDELKVASCTCASSRDARRGGISHTHLSGVDKSELGFH
jgi:hypothetical protein